MAEDETLFGSSAFVGYESDCLVDRDPATIPSPGPRTVERSAEGGSFLSHASVAWKPDSAYEEKYPSRSWGKDSLAICEEGAGRACWILFLVRVNACM